LIIMVGVVFGAVFGLLFTAMRQWFPGTALAKASDTAHFCWSYSGIHSSETARGDLKNVLHPVVIGVATSIVSMLWIGYALGMVILLERFERRWPTPFLNQKHAYPFKIFLPPFHIPALAARGPVHTGTALLNPARKRLKPGSTPAHAARDLPKMNPAQKQFSVNRAESKKRIPFS